MKDPIDEYKGYKDFTTLDAWKNARTVRIFFYDEVIPRLPPQEKYNLDVQIRKASVSGTANIAEGYGRFHHKEAIQFYRISRGSLYELKDHLTSCADCKYVTDSIVEKGNELIETAKMSLNGYIRYIESKIRSGT